MARRRHLVQAVLALVVFVGLASGGAAQRVVAVGSAAFADPAGDGYGAPDVTAVAVGDDLASGLIQISVTAAGIASINAASKPEVDLFLDTDRKGSTGSTVGAEYSLSAWRTPKGSYWDIQRWERGVWQSMPESGTISFSASGDVLTWKLGKGDIGGPTGFDFYVAAKIFDGSGKLVARDFAPNSKRWTYMLTAPTRSETVSLSPVISKPVTVPARATAGKRLMVTFRVTRSDNGRPLASGTMVCDPSVAGKLIRHAETFKAGVARLSFVVPRSAEDKRLKVKVTITAPSYQEDGIYVDPATGQTGALTTTYSGHARTRVATIQVR
jgi:hypothetical protein